MAKMRFKRPTAELLVRMPKEMMGWIEQQSQRSFTSRNAEIVRSVQERMDAEKRAASSQQGQRRAG